MILRSQWDEQIAAIFMINGVWVEAPSMDSAILMIQPTQALVTHVAVAVMAATGVSRKRKQKQKP